MADELITQQEFATWTQTPLATVSEDPFALEVMEKVSAYVRFVAKKTVEQWPTAAALPYDARMVVLWMCKRTYTNPDQEKSTGVGPISSTVLDEAALAMNLSESEAAVLMKYAAEAEDADPGLWTFSLGGVGPVLEPAYGYVTDDKQVNLGETLPWMFPLYNPDDPGSD